MTEQQSRLTAALADRYRIERELGAGGMAIVYLAEDRKLGRMVALKVLRPELAAALGAERFLREIAIAAKLNHPHILPLHDSGEAAGFLYYVMPYVEGESLRDRLNREKQLPIEDALRIAREVADALGSAHRHDVLHRDIKPENILLEEGHAVVADFGIARAIDMAGGDRLTETGISLGTPHYMSPEQATGNRDLDGRSDLYSLGCVLYEMLGGEPPFTGATVESIIHQQIAVEPRPVTALRPAVPADVTAALTRVLSKAQADRFNPAAQFADALGGSTTGVTVAGPGSPTTTRAPRRWMGIAGALAIAMMVFAVVYWQRSTSSAGDVDAPPRVIVLPLENLGAPEDDYIADGITEAITTRLAAIGGLRVISRQTAVQYKDSPLSAPEIAGELAVQYLLEGTVQRARPGDLTSPVRVNPQLIRAAEDTHLWAQSYDVQMDDVFQVYADIAEAVARELDITLLAPARRQIEDRPTDHPLAYDHYMRGNLLSGELQGRSTDQLENAGEAYERAVELDPTFADAFARLARVRLYLFWDHGRADQLPLAEAALDSAVALAPNRASTKMTLGLYYYQGQRNYGRALEQFEAMLQLQPSNAEAREWGAYVRRRQGDFSLALAQMNDALSLNPQSRLAAYSLGQTYGMVREYELAERFTDLANALQPTDNAYRNKVFLYLHRYGNTSRAHRVADERQRRLGSRWPWIDWSLAIMDRDFLKALDVARPDSILGPWPYLNMLTHYLNGDRTAAVRAADSSVAVTSAIIDRTPPGTRTQSYARAHSELGLAYAILGRKNEAIDLGQRAVGVLPVLIDAVDGPTMIWRLARIYVVLGEHERALEQLEAFMNMPSRLYLPPVGLDPIWDPIRSHPRFEALLAKSVDP